MRKQAALLGVCVLSLTATACASRAKLVKSVLQSPVIFEGTVKLTKDSLETEFVPRAPNTHVVTVEKVYTEAEQFNQFQGQDVTVRIVPGSPIDAERIQKQQRFLFLTSPLVFANTLVLEGEARRPNRQTVEVVQNRPELQLAQRIHLADLIVRGTVLSVEALQRQKDDREGEDKESEHDPLWGRARVQIEAVGKGRSKGTIDVLFPTSFDIVWHRAPKYSVKQYGTWLLQRTRVNTEQKEAFTAMHPLDFHPGRQQNPLLEKRLKSIETQRTVEE